MSDPDQLREYARDCLRLAQEMASPELKLHLINMAEAWAALAHQSERIATICAAVPMDGMATPLAPQADPAHSSPPADGVPGAMTSPSLSPEAPTGSMAEPPAKSGDQQGL